MLPLPPTTSSVVTLFNKPADNSGSDVACCINAVTLVVAIAAIVLNNVGTMVLLLMAAAVAVFVDVAIVDLAMAAIIGGAVLDIVEDIVALTELIVVDAKVDIKVVAAVVVVVVVGAIGMYGYDGHGLISCGPNIFSNT